MARSSVTRLAALIATVSAAATVGCSAAPENEQRVGVAVPAAGEGAMEASGTPQLMRTHRVSKAGADTSFDNTAAVGTLKYYGGPVISKVKVFAIYWGDGVANTNEMEAYYASVTNSRYFDWLAEYNTPTQKIRRGSFVGSYADVTPAVSGSSVTNDDIQAEIASLMAAKLIPQADDNTLFMVHFAPGITISQADGSQSCVQFCAYHNTFSQSGQNVYYGVIPDQSGDCSLGCGKGTAMDNLKSVASHELVEAVTDPAIGLARALGAPIAWYDKSNGEIGDICNGQAGRADGLPVQKEWSNANQACVDVDPTVPAP